MFYKFILIFYEQYSYIYIEKATAFGRGAISKLINKFLEYSDILYRNHENARGPRALRHDGKRINSA